MKSCSSAHKRNSVQSCRTEDKCYCSLGGESTTTWCDTDSCISTTKCYCKHQVSNAKAERANRACISDSLALDYELFTVGKGTNGKHVRSQEALSVKKSVEMAALFADVKLSQTTDIKNLAPGTSSEEDSRMRRATKEATVERRLSNKGESVSSSRSRNDRSSHRVAHEDETHKLYRKPSKKNINDLYQTIAPRAVSDTLEDSLGYLP